jgi:hypothetical protein
METTAQKITPKLAMEWLALRYDGQRIVKERQVQKLATAISRGEWRENGATIVFNRRGDLIDGQHRLHAIVRADKSVWSLVVNGISNTELTFQSIDDSLARVAGDFLDCKNRHNVAAVGKILWHVVNDDFPKMRLKPPIADLLRTLKPWIPIVSEEILNRVRPAGKLTGQGSFVTFLCLYYIHVTRVAPEEVVLGFFDSVGDGVNQGRGSPVLALRNRFTTERNERLHEHPSRAMIMKALHAYMDGKILKKLSFNSITEPFPELRNGVSSEPDSTTEAD